MDAGAGPLRHAARSRDRIGTAIPNAHAPLIGRRLLLVEDEYVIAMEMERGLRSAGADVVGPVSNVAHALDLIARDGRLDAAILDVNLGNGERVDPVADRLDALGVPYLFATGDVRIGSDPAYRHRARLEKPILGSELVRAVATLLRPSPRVAPLRP